MADTAAHLVDRVFPSVPIRQWLLSLPFGPRCRLACDSGLISDVPCIFNQTIFSSLPRRARQYCGIRKSGEVGIIHLIRSRDRIHGWRRSKKGGLFGLLVEPAFLVGFCREAAQTGIDTPLRLPTHDRRPRRRTHSTSMSPTEHNAVDMPGSAAVESL
jgi:hypothetical protein